MNSEKNTRTAFTGFAGVGILFLVLYFILAWFNRPAADDFYFLHTVKQQGILGMTWTAYSTWITRWTALPLTGIVFQLAGERFFWFHALTLIALLAICAAWLLFLFQRLSLRPGLYLVSLYVLLFIFSFFQFSVSVGETWFWVTSVCMYLWPWILFLAGSRLLFLPGVAAVTGCVLCFLFIGGGSEVVALEACAALSAVAWLKHRQPHRVPWISWKNLLAALVALVLSLFIAWLGPGRAARQDALPVLTIGNQLLLAAQSAGYFLLIQLPLKVHWVLFCTIPWIVLRHALQPDGKEPVSSAFAFVFKAALVFAGFVLLHYLITTSLLKSFPPPRTSLTLSFALAAFCAVSGWRLGALPWNVAKNRFISIVFVLACSILLVHGIVTQKEIAGEYARAFDERMLLLQKSAGSEKEIVVAPLPSSGLLYSAEISTDTAHFTNRQLRDYMGLLAAPKRAEK